MSAEYHQIRVSRAISGIASIAAPQKSEQGHDGIEHAREHYVPPEPPLAMELDWLPSMLWRRRSQIAAISVLGPLLAILYVTLAAPLYTASTRLLIESRALKVISSEALVPDIGNPDVAVMSQVEVLRSSRWAERVIRALGLYGIPKSDSAAAELSAAHELLSDDERQSGVPAPGVKGRGVKEHEPAAAPLEPIPTTLINRFMSRLNVRRIDPTSLIEVSFTDSDPELAATIANSIADAYLDDQVIAKSAATRRANEWLKIRLADLKEQVRESEAAIERFKGEHGLYDIGQQTLSERMLSVTSDQLVTARTAADAAQAKLEQVERLRSDKSGLTMPGFALQSELLRDFRRQYADVTRKRTNLVVRFGAQHPDVLNADAELKDLEKQMDQEIVRVIDSARDEYVAAKSQVTLLEEKVEQLKHQLTKGNKVAVDLSELKREAAATSNLYASLLTRFHETEAQESLHMPDARVVSEAVAPLAPSHPRKSLAVLLALASSVLLALTLAFVRELTEHVFRSQKDVERVLGLDLVAEVPRLAAGEGAAPRTSFWGLELPETTARVLFGLAYRVREARVRAANALIRLVPARWRRAELELPAGPAGPMTRENIPRPLLGSELSSFSEAMYLVKAAIESRPPRMLPKVVAFISAQSGEGKSTLALNLADYVATCGGSALLVDCDLRSAGLTRRLVPDASLSLVDVVTSEAGPDSVFVMNAETGFDFCPASLVPLERRPADLLSSDRITRLIAEVRPNYDVVILDTAALGEAVDARPLLRLADAIVLVVEAERTTHEDVMELLRDAGWPSEKLAGIVLNKTAHA